MWYNIEVNLAIFIACGPAYLAFFRYYIPSVFGASSHRTLTNTTRTNSFAPTVATRNNSLVPITQFTPKMKSRFELEVESDDHSSNWSHNTGGFGDTVEIMVGEIDLGERNVEKR